MADGDQAKTPDELEAEAKAAEGKFEDALKKHDDANRHESQVDHDQAMADVLFGAMVGASRSGPDESARTRRGWDTAQASDEARAARQRANWARRAIAYGLTLAGATLALAGVAGAGNGPAVAPDASPAATVTATATPTPGPSGVANRAPHITDEVLERALTTFQRPTPEELALFDDVI